MDLNFAMFTHKMFISAHYLLSMMLNINNCYYWLIDFSSGGYRLSL